MKNSGIETDFYSPKIVNVVGTFVLDIKERLKLDDIASRWNGSRYNKLRFSGLVTSSDEPKATYMIFSNGNVNITGAKSEAECQLSSKKLIKKMSKLGVLKSLKPSKRFQVRNIVATVETKLKINLEVMNNKQSLCTFNPDTFPGLIYRMREPNSATFLVFSSGKIVMVGLKSEAHVMTCFRQFYKTLKKYKVTDKNKILNS